ncbi:MAG TPA: response regulator [Arachidicoccus sp.]|nr:response regulator [Arachidicoccus sp.]
MKPVILIVDDQKDILEFLSNQLLVSYNVLTSLSGKDAMGILDKEIVHLIISDIMMPHMDGLEFCQLIKSNFDTSHIPVILLTAIKTLETKIEGLEFGADAYIEKPFSPKYLRAQISNLLTNRNRLKEFFVTSPSAHLKSIAYTKSDEQFLENLNEVIQKNIKNQELYVQFLAKSMNMSRATLFRKIKGVCNLTPNELVNVSRLKRAAELLNQGCYKMFEIANMVGFTSQHHFARSFHKQFNMTPTEFQLKSKRLDQHNNESAD